MLSLEIFEKSAEASAVTMAEMIAMMLRSFRDMGLPDKDTVDGLLEGIDSLSKEYRNANSDFDNEEVLNTLRVELNKISEVVKRLRGQ